MHCKCITDLDEIILTTGIFIFRSYTSVFHENNSPVVVHAESMPNCMPAISSLLPFRYNLLAVSGLQLSPDSYLLLVVLLQMIATVEEAMASHHPLLLHQALKTCQTPAMRVAHELHQRRNDAAQIPVFFFCREKPIRKKLSKVSDEQSEE